MPRMLRESQPSGLHSNPSSVLRDGDLQQVYFLRAPLSHGKESEKDHNMRLNRDSVLRAAGWSPHS